MFRRSTVRVAVAYFAAALVTLVPSDRARGQCELAKVTASDRAPHDHFGAAVAMDGDFVVIGAPGTERVGREFVPSYVFQRVGSTWIEHTILDPDDISPRSHFGRSVAISGDVVVVGAIVDGHSEPFAFDGHGSAYVYRYDGGVWTEEAKLLASDAAMGAFFGGSVAIAGTRIVVGASGTNVRTGSTYIFEFNGDEWMERARLTATDGSEFDYFGYTVAADGPAVAVTALNVGHTEPSSFDGVGAVYVFRFDGQGWNEEQKLTVEGLPPRTSFGFAASVSGDRILIGAHGADMVGRDSGAAFVFRREESEWIHEATLLGEDTQASDRFGVAAALRGDLALVGANYTDWGVGAVYVFQRNGNAWGQVTKLVASDGFSQQRFGSAVALDAPIAAVGATGGSGSAYFYQIVGGLDCNENGINDACEHDCNENGVPDECDIAGGTSNDCNGNAIADDCESDCNLNGVADDCDIGKGTSDDCNANIIPDECETDCNTNGVPDDCDIAGGTSDDCNANRLPDDCEPDCNGNDIADSCDIDAGTSGDCNRNDVPDDCEPDDDCNRNGVQDFCDIAAGTSEDCNRTGIPDECEVAEARFFGTEAPGLLGLYGGYIGDFSNKSKFDFGQDFAVVRNTWLRITVSNYWPTAVECYGCLEGGGCGPSVYGGANLPGVEFCVPLISSDAVLDGRGSVRLAVFPLECCDWQVGVKEASLWFDAIVLPEPTSLRDFGSFQTCFSGNGGGTTSTCAHLDYDHDDDVDLNDYTIFQMAFSAPSP